MDGLRSPYLVVYACAAFALVACGGPEPTEEAARAETATANAARRGPADAGQGRRDPGRDERGPGDDGGSRRNGPPRVGSEVHHDLSAPLMLIRPAPPIADPGDPETDPRPLLYRAPTFDPVVQTTPGTAAAPAALGSFEGMGDGFSGPSGSFFVGSTPPDTDGDVGPNHYVQLVNINLTVFRKDGTPVLGPVYTRTLWTGFGGGCENSYDGDGIVRYDPIADRWLVSEFYAESTPYLECVAISQTGDPTGAYYRYAFSYDQFNDYPKFGVWPDAYYVTFNMYDAVNGTFTGAQACAYDRASMLAGLPARQVCFQLSPDHSSLLPADLDGARLPPAGEPNVLAALDASASALDFWAFHVDWSTPTRSTLTGPTSLPVAPYGSACPYRVCIPQSDTAQTVDAMDDRLMNRLAYRNFGDHESLVVSHTVAAAPSSGVRWYEIRLPGGKPTLYQQGTYAPDASYRWMASAAQDQAGNIALGFSVSSAATYPAIHYTGRLAGDPLGQMTQGETALVNGTGSQTDSWRWGDYSSMTVDPTDDCTFWYTNQYQTADGTFDWHTRIGSFKLANCPTSAPPASDFSISVAPASASAVQGGTATYSVATAVTSGSPGTVTFSASGLPAGATATFTPPSVSAGASATLTVSVGASTVPGTYAFTVTGTGTSGSHAATAGLTVTAATTGGGGIVNGGFETGLSGWTAKGTAGVTSSAHGGQEAAQLGSMSATKGDSSLSQTFTVPASASSLSFWYAVTCWDTVAYDWATATLKDNTVGTTTVILRRTCNSLGAWKQVTARVTPGHSVTLTLTNHDDAWPSDPTFTLFDDVTVR